MRQSILIIVIAILSVLTGNQLVQAQATDTPLFVREDCVWEYEYYFSGAMGYNTHHELRKYKFESSVEIERKTYNVLKHFHTTKWYINEPDKTGLEEEDVDIVVGLIREENGKVWMRNNPNNPILKQNGNVDKYEYVEGIKEILLYDFSVKEGDIVPTYAYWSWGTLQGDYYTISDYDILETSEIDDRIMYTARYTDSQTPYENDFKYTLGVGNIGNGTILGPELVILVPTNGSYYWESFNNQYDLEGNVIYAGKGTIAGVSAVEADARQDGRMYDVMGREISNPQPGTIYIQNGHKFIAR